MKEAYCADYKQSWLEASGAAAAAADALLRTERMRVVERGCTYHEVVFFRCRALHTLPRAATSNAAAPHTRVAYADSLRWAFARRMARRTACAAHRHVLRFWRCD
jgi:hypothetical protein